MLNMFIHGNIKFLRLRKGVTQADASASMSFSRSQLAGYESTIRPTLDALLSLSAYFCISTDALLKVELGTLTEYKVRELIHGNESFISGNKLRVIATSVSNEGEDLTEVVPVRARAGYMNGHTDPEYIGELPRLTFPFLSKSLKYRMFQLEGDSMLPMNTHSYVVCSYLDNWNRLVEGHKYVLLTRQEGIVFKLVYFKKADKSTLLLCSLNTEYKPFEINMENILEIWRFEIHITEPLYA